MTDDERATTTEEQVRVRRAPKYPAFMIVGGGIGAIGTFIATMVFPADPDVGYAALFGYFALYGVTAGVVIGALLALLADRLSMRRAREATVAHTSVEAPPLEGELED